MKINKEYQAEIHVHTHYLEQYALYLKNPENYEHFDQHDISTMENYYQKALTFFENLPNGSLNYNCAE